MILATITAGALGIYAIVAVVGAVVGFLIGSKHPATVAAAIAEIGPVLAEVKALTTQVVPAIAEVKTAVADIKAAVITTPTVKK